MVQKGENREDTGIDLSEPGICRLFRDVVHEEVSSADTVFLVRSERGRFRSTERRGKYSLIEKIGEGGMSDVWKAWDHKLEKRVALKFLKEREGVRNGEASLLEMVTHPGIVKGYESGVLEGVPYISMEFIEGVPLSHLPGNHVSRVVKILQNVSEVVHYSHTQGVVHYDLKPSNILIDKADRITILDFGVARRIDQKNDHLRKGYVFGTPPYLSPEIALKGARIVDPRSDIYALGVILFEVLTGYFPETGFFPSIQERNPQVDSKLENIIRCCLSRNPQDRYSSAGDLALALAEWWKGHRDLDHNTGRFFAASAGILALGMSVPILGW
jgi:serine/threonine protein kinase